MIFCIRLIKKVLQGRSQPDWLKKEVLSVHIFKTQKEVEMIN